MDRIRVMRWFFIHGFSTLINNGWFTIEEIDDHIVLKEMKIRLKDIVKMANHALYEGLKNDDIFKTLGIEIYKADTSGTDFGKGAEAGAALPNTDDDPM